MIYDVISTGWPVLSWTLVFVNVLKTIRHLTIKHKISIFDVIFNYKLCFNELSVSITVISEWTILLEILIPIDTHLLSRSIMPICGIRSDHFQHFFCLKVAMNCQVKYKEKISCISLENINKYSRPLRMPKNY